MKERIARLKEEYLEKKQERKDMSEAYIKESSDFMNFCQAHSAKYEKYFPHLNVNQRNAKLWEQFCVEWQNDKESKAI